MRKIIDIALLDIRVFLSSMGNVVAITILPIILTLALGGVGGDGSAPQQIRVDVLDMDNSAASQTLMTQLHETNSSLVLCPIDNTDGNFCNIAEDETLTLESSQNRVADGVSSALIVIPADYGEMLQNLTPVTIEYYSQAGIANTDPVYQSLQTALQQVNGAAVAARMGVAYVDMLSESLNGVDVLPEENQDTYRDEVYTYAAEALAAPAVSVQYELSRDGVQDESTTIPGGFGQSVPGMATMFVLFTVLAGMELLLRERKQWTLQRMIVSPSSRAQILGGKILSRFLLGMLQFMIVFAVGLLVGLDFGENALLTIPVMMAYTLCVTALAFAIAPHLRSEGQASSLTTLMAMSMAALGGAWWSLSLPFIPEFMRVIGHLTPVAWAMRGFNEIVFYGGGLTDIVLPCAVLLAASTVLFGFGIATFRYE